MRDNVKVFESRMKDKLKMNRIAPMILIVNIDQSDSAGPPGRGETLVQRVVWSNPP